MTVKWSGKDSDRLIIQSVDGGLWAEWMDLSAPIHGGYATRCGADYWYFLGTWEAGVHPAWNRLPMILEAFAMGYEKVVWLDGDTLVVNQDRNIFAETRDDVPFQMTRVLHAHVEMPWPEPGWDPYNDGVLVTNRSRESIAAVQWVWEQRHTPHLAHHHPSMWELNWLLDWIFAHRDDVGLLSQIWNWMPFAEAPPREEAVILAWHGMPFTQRWTEYREALRVHYPEVRQ